MYTRSLQLHPPIVQDRFISIHPPIVHKHTASSSFHRTQGYCMSIHQSTHCTQQQEQQKQHRSCSHPSSILHKTITVPPIHPLYTTYCSSIQPRIVQMNIAAPIHPYTAHKNTEAPSISLCTKEHCSSIHASVVHKNIDAPPIYPLYIKTSQLELLPKVSNFSICTPCPSPPLPPQPPIIPLAFLQPSLRQ